jgi:starvation-inducible outer membrane lipoprotein
LNTKNGGVVTVAEFLADVESSDFNPLDYNFFPTMEAQVYKLKGVNKIIYILPQDVILAK